MKRVLVVFHSQTGNTQRLAEAAAAGAEQEPGVAVTTLRAGDAGLDDLLACDGLLLGTPENFGYMSGMVKDFLDRTYYPAQGKLAPLPYGLVVSAGNDGRGAVREIERIAKGYPLKPIGEAVIARGALTATHLAAARELGQTMAAGLALGIF